MADRSLYYPYIHIRDVDWLKSTLLLFDQVRRMTPVPGAQADDGPILPFTQVHGGREDPMVFPANLQSERAVAAQRDLASRLRKDAEDEEFRRLYGRSAAESMKGPGDYGFQIHQRKLHEDLKEALREADLIWDPRIAEPYDPGLEYVELHPRIGQAVMATLAIACAIHEGLSIVGDRRSGPLHECLTRKQPEEVYDAWLNPERDIPDPPKADARELFEFVVFLSCDPTGLDAEALAKMDRKPVRRLMDELAKRATHMVAMDPGKDRTQQFKDETADILEAWKNDRANMSNYWKRFFGFGLLEKGGEFFKKLLEDAAKATPAATTGAAGALAGLALHGPLLATGAGLGIGLFTHAATTYIDLIKTERESPYRYLTLMEQAGVVIRTDVRYLPDSQVAAASRPH
jgi:hypothetical protein